MLYKVKPNRLGGTINEMYHFLSFSPHQELQCVSLCYRTGLIAPTQLEYSVRYHQWSPARIKVLLWVESIDEKWQHRNHVKLYKVLSEFLEQRKCFELVQHVPYSDHKEREHRSTCFAQNFWMYTVKNVYTVSYKLDFIQSPEHVCHETRFDYASSWCQSWNPVEVFVIASFRRTAHRSC